MRWLLTLVGVSLGAIAQAQPYPAKPIHIIIPYAAGGGPDIQVRQFGQKLSEAIRQPVILENKVGAAGVLAAQYVMQQPADGYT
jgi:tripartite-type tricarboxylate transporter receptor subunit TctC